MKSAVFGLVLSLQRGDAAHMAKLLSFTSLRTDAPQLPQTPIPLVLRRRRSGRADLVPSALEVFSDHRHWDHRLDTGAGHRPGQ